MLANTVYDKWFQVNLHFTQRSFRLLCKLLQPLQTRRCSAFVRHSFTKRVAVTLYYLNSMGGYREAAQTFGVSKSWAVTAVNAMLGAIADDYQRFIFLPTTVAEWASVQTGFQQRAGVPLVCAAVDGTLIEVARFADFEGWYCRKGYPAVNLQAVIDHAQRFISFDLRPGSWSDKKIWAASDFGRRIDEILPSGGFILGDAGYTLSNTVLTPYDSGNHSLDLNCCQRNYNFKHSQTRIVVECAFATWKNRFRILRRPQEAKNVCNMSATIVASMILHNIAIDIRDTTPLPDPMVDITEDEDVLGFASIDGTESKTQQERERRQRGIALRNDIADYLQI
ncbi:hypothetical protein PHMEG_0002743 [Phytophthora megakarya]|uniref:DDE Tnp4 domain-containing protein n=1 Tax=Phytophthora megakarya TaxID=4795 RepID=A0A225WY20_9STRA|nr:hypothetical protein PHMEG_0002743 [Phytophthora megakarya]